MKKYILLIFLVVILIFCNACTNNIDTTPKNVIYERIATGFPEKHIYVLGVDTQLELDCYVKTEYVDRKGEIIQTDEYELDSNKIQVPSLAFEKAGMYEIECYLKSGAKDSFEICTVDQDWILQNAAYIKYLNDELYFQRATSNSKIREIIIEETDMGIVDRSFSYNFDSDLLKVMINDIYEEDELVIERTISIDDAEIVEEYLYLADFGVWNDEYMFSSYLDDPSLIYEGGWSIRIVYEDDTEREIIGDGSKNVPERYKYVDLAIGAICPEYDHILWTY